MFLLFPDPQRMTDLGHVKLANCPFLITKDGSYPREANQYLRERSFAEWQPRLGQLASQNGKIVIQTRKSRESMGRRLIEFFKMCERSEPQMDWQSVSYDDLLDWQSGLLLGTQSSSGKALKNGTVNALITEAIYFLTWAADRTYRQPFSILLNEVRIKNSSGKYSHNSKITSIQTRVGALRLKPDFSMLPTNLEIEKWLHQVHFLRGPVKHLCCEMICRTGLRITECIELQLDDIPKKVNGEWPSTVIENNSLRIRVHRGNKGKKVSPGSLESTTPRYVYIPIDLAERIDHYIQVVRSTFILRAIDRIKNKEERQRRMRSPKPTHLWVGEVSGLPFSSKMLYKAWTSVPAYPPHFHPHKGREFFAVETMVNYMLDLLKARGVFQIDGVNKLGWLDSLMSNQIRVILTPLMGHINQETTELYLKKMKHRLIDVMGHPAIRWAEICAEEGKSLEDE
jgi:integrase